jgi:hypothetical protein
VVYGNRVPDLRVADLSRDLDLLGSRLAVSHVSELLTRDLISIPMQASQIRSLHTGAGRPGPPKGQ